MVGRALAWLGRRWVAFAATFYLLQVMLFFTRPVWVAVATLPMLLVVERLLAGLRREPLARRLLCVASIAHVLYWTGCGLLREPPQPGDAEMALEGIAWSDYVEPHVGFGSARFHLPATTPLAGWSGSPRRTRFPPWGAIGPLGRWAYERMRRTSVPDGLADDVEAAALFVTPQEPAAPHDLGARAIVWGGGKEVPLVLVSLDLLGTSREIHGRVAARLHGRGVRPAGLWLAATHTHSGPGCVFRDRLLAVLATDRFAAPLEDEIVLAAERAIEAALDDMRPATLRFLERTLPADAALGRPRHGAEPAPSIVRCIAVGEPDGPIRGALLHVAVHATYHDRNHLRFDRDVAGALELRLGQELGGVPVVLVQGALGDVAPAVIPGAQNAEESLVALAQRGVSWIRDAVAATPPHDRMRLAAAAMQRQLGTPRLLVGTGERRALHEAVRVAPFRGSFDTWGRDALALPVNALLWSAALTDVRFHVAPGLEACGVAVDLGPLVERRADWFGAWRFESEAGESWTLCAQPGEATSQSGRGWEAAIAAESGGAVWTTSLVNGCLGYVADESHMARGGYEAVGTLYGFDTATQVGEVLRAASRRARISLEEVD